MIKTAINRHEQTAAADALGFAFTQDPVMAELLPNVPHDERSSRYSTVFNAMLRIADPSRTKVDLALHDGEVVGAAIWRAPATSGRHLRAPALTQLRQLRRLVAAVGLPGVVRLFSDRTNSAEYRPLEPHWYLADIGVLPCGQGTGVGRALLDAGLERVDADAAVTYLEATTDVSRRWYERAGFVAVGQISGYATARPYAMIRHARESTTPRTTSEL